MGWSGGVGGGVEWGGVGWVGGGGGRGERVEVVVCVEGGGGGERDRGGWVCGRGDLSCQFTRCPFLVNQNNSRPTQSSRTHAVTLTCPCTFSFETSPIPTTCSRKPLVMFDYSGRCCSCKLPGTDHLVPLCASSVHRFDFRGQCRFLALFVQTVPNSADLQEGRLAVVVDIVPATGAMV